VRVLTVGNMYPPHHLGGYELVWQDSVRHLRAAGHEVRVLTTSFRRDDPAVGEDDPDSDVHRELGWYWRDHDWPRFGLPARLRLERRNAEILERHLAELRPDAVGWWAMGGLSLSLIERVRSAGIPAAGFVCDEWMVYGPRVDAWLRFARLPVIGPLTGRLAGIPTRVRFSDVGPWLFPSETLRRKSAEPWGLADTAVVHQGVDRRVFAPEEPSPWSWRLLYVGRIDPRKGIDLAVRALRELPREASLEVVGGGDSRHLDELRKLARGEGVAERVGFHPPEPQVRLRERYAHADALVFPVRWEEPWGLVPLEAMSVGTPVVASGRGGSGEYLEDGLNCLTFDPDLGPGALAERLGRLAGDEALRRRLREGGLRTSEAFPADAFNRGVESTLSSVAVPLRRPAGRVPPPASGSVSGSGRSS
jgi:glycogen(starch) synthase